MRTKIRTEKGISVVIITKNEEKNIATCIRSVLKAIANFDRSEVILVDSASTDRTINIARDYQIKIIQLSPLQPLSPSAGRYIGSLHARGEYILFIDGDMKLDKEWLYNAIPFLERNQKIAGVTGIVENIYLKNGKIVDKEENIQRINNHPEVTNMLGGAILYKRSVLKEVGNFNPYICSNEEIELCYRIQKDGYKVFRIPCKMVTHYTILPYSIKYIKMKFRSNMFIGLGQTLRYSLKDGLFWSHVRRLKLYFTFMACLFLGIIIFSISILTGNFLTFFIWFVFVITSFIFHSVRKRSIRKAFYRIFHWTCSSYGIINGFIQKPREPACYSTKNVRIIS